MCTASLLPEGRRKGTPETCHEHELASQRSSPLSSERKIAGEKTLWINNRVELLLRVTFEHKALKGPCED